MPGAVFRPHPEQEFFVGPDGTQIERTVLLRGHPGVTVTAP
jgi:hypothetical protein